jgi:streptomycin 6-kinase
MSTLQEKLEQALDKLKRAKERWKLRDDGETLSTEVGLLQPVLFEGLPAMLKVPFNAKEGRGFRLLDCWGGIGAVKVYQYNAEALLMERAVGDRSLKKMVFAGQEDQANGIICRVVEQLHASACGSVSDLVPLDEWFESLPRAAEQYGGIFTSSRKIAEALLSNPQDIVALHGDIHYDNILDSGSRGWIAIDPKGLFGERGFDYANIFCNPDLSIAGSPERLSRQVELIAAASSMEGPRLLHWILAWSGLCAAWTLEDGKDPKLPLLVAELALLELKKY